MSDRPRDVLDADACRFEWQTEWPDAELHLCKLPSGHDDDDDEHKCMCGRADVGNIEWRYVEWRHE